MQYRRMNRERIKAKRVEERNTEEARVKKPGRAT